MLHLLIPTFCYRQSDLVLSQLAMVAFRNKETVPEIG